MYEHIEILYSHKYLYISIYKIILLCSTSMAVVLSYCPHICFLPPSYHCAATKPQLSRRDSLLLQVPGRGPTQCGTWRQVLRRWGPDESMGSHLTLKGLQQGSAPPSTPPCFPDFSWNKRTMAFSECHLQEFNVRSLCRGAVLKASTSSRSCSEDHLTIQAPSIPSTPGWPTHTFISLLYPRKKYGIQPPQGSKPNLSTPG